MEYTLTDAQKEWLSENGKWVQTPKGIIYRGKLKLRQYIKWFDTKCHKIPVKFYIVDGVFDVSECELTSLKNSPETVDCFYTEYNKLRNLIGGPKHVRSEYVCDNNDLTTLKGAPITVNNFYCRGNQLTDLKYLPKYINKLDCRNNRIETLSGIQYAKEIYADFNNLTNLIGCPELISHLSINGNNCTLLGLKHITNTLSSDERDTLIFELSQNNVSFNSYNEYAEWILQNDKLDLLRQYKDTKIRDYFSENILFNIDNGMFNNN